MLASFLIPFHSYRLDNLLQTIYGLEKNDNEIVKKSELILLCQDKCGEIQTEFKETKMFNMMLENMNKPIQLNFGVSKAQSDILVVLDSDRILPHNYFKDKIQILEEKTLITTKQMYKLHKPYSNEDLINQTFEGHIEERTTTNKPYARNAFSGNAILHKNSYLKANGMDESYDGYGFEDSDMVARLNQAGVKFKFEPEIEIHLYHEGHTYGTGNQKKLFIDNGFRFFNKWNVQMPEEFQRELYSYTRNVI